MFAGNEEGRNSGIFSGRASSGEEDSDVVVSEELGNCAMREATWGV